MGGVSFSQEKIRKKIRKLKAHLAAGLDETGLKELQELEDQVVAGLTKIFRESYETCWKEGRQCDTNLKKRSQV
jgi:hypothetical protein